MLFYDQDLKKFYIRPHLLIFTYFFNDYNHNNKMRSQEVNCFRIIFYKISLSYESNCYFYK